MNLRLPVSSKLVIRLIGAAFGMALALFLFASVAAGHGYRAQTSRQAAVAHVQVTHVAFPMGNGAFFGNGFDNRFFGDRFFDNRFFDDRFFGNGFFDNWFFFPNRCCCCCC
jgi:hypothetical protein